MVTHTLLSHGTQPTKLLVAESSQYHIAYERDQCQLGSRSSTILIKLIC